MSDDASDNAQGYGARYSAVISVALSTPFKYISTGAFPTCESELWASAGNYKVVQ